MQRIRNYRFRRERAASVLLACLPCAWIVFAERRACQHESLPLPVRQNRPWWLVVVINLQQGCSRPIAQTNAPASVRKAAAEADGVSQSIDRCKARGLVGSHQVSSRLQNCALGEDATYVSTKAIA